jgi:hypothetical protein
MLDKRLLITWSLESWKDVKVTFSTLPLDVTSDQESPLTVAVLLYPMLL